MTMHSEHAGRKNENSQEITDAATNPAAAVAQPAAAASPNAGATPAPVPAATRMDSFERLMEQAPFSVIISRVRDGTLRYGNQRAKLQFGFSGQEGIGLAASDFYVHVSDRDRFLQQIFTQGSAQDWEMELRDLQGQAYWALMSGTLTEYENEPAIMVAIKNIDVRKKAQMALQDQSHVLEERVKELNCLYSVFALTEQDQLTVDMILQQVVSLMVNGWQYPEITEVQIEWAGRIFATPGFKLSAWQQVVTQETAAGDPVRLIIAYQEERPSADEGPFLAEERDLAAAIVHRLAEVLARRRLADLAAEQTALVQLMYREF